MSAFIDLKMAVGLAVVRDRRTNPFPARRRGLWRVRALPYLSKDRWPEAPFGDRWRAVKARLRPTADAGRRSAVGT